MALKALLLENINPSATQLLESKGLIVSSQTHALPEPLLAQQLIGVSILGIRSKTKVTKQVIDQAKTLKVVAAFCIGTDQIDLEYCQHKNISVINAPFQNSRSVAELALGEIIILARGVFDKSLSLHQGNWQKSSSGCFELRGKTLGIIGYGNIGSQLSILAEGLGMKVIYFDLIEKCPYGNAEQCFNLYQLLQTADIVSVHIDGRSSNKHFMADEKLAHMKPGSLFLNLSRGFVIDQKALAKRIKSGQIMGCAIDVFETEPAKNGDTFYSPLQNLPNVLLTPHIGGSTQEAQIEIASYVANKIIGAIKT